MTDQNQWRNVQATCNKPVTWAHGETSMVFAKTSKEGGETRNSQKASWWPRDEHFSSNWEGKGQPFQPYQKLCINQTLISGIYLSCISFQNPSGAFHIQTHYSSHEEKRNPNEPKKGVLVTRLRKYFVNVGEDLLIFEHLSGTRGILRNTFSL